MSEYMYEFITVINIIHDIDQVSDHSVLSVAFNIFVGYACGTLKCENASICEKVAKCEEISTLNVKIDAICEKITLNLKCLYI